MALSSTAFIYPYSILSTFNSLSKKKNPVLLIFWSLKHYRVIRNKFGYLSQHTNSYKELEVKLQRRNFCTPGSKIAYALDQRFSAFLMLRPLNNTVSHAVVTPAILWGTGNKMANSVDMPTTSGELPCYRELQPKKSAAKETAGSKRASHLPMPQEDSLNTNSWGITWGMRRRARELQPEAAARVQALRGSGLRHGTTPVREWVCKEPRTFNMLGSTLALLSVTERDSSAELLLSKVQSAGSLSNTY